MATEYVESGVPFLRSQNIQPFRIDDSDLKFIAPEFHTKLKKSALRPGDVAIVRTGYPGTAAVIPQKFHTLNCADLVIVRPSKDLNPWFLTCILNSSWGRGAVAGNLVGVAQQHFNVSAAKEMEVLLPDIDTQRRIASILSAYDDLIENNARRIAILEEMARRIYEEWFVRFRFPGHEKVRMVESELGLVPEGWVVRRVGEILSRRANGTVYKKESVQSTGSTIVIDQSTLEFLGFHDNVPDHPATVDSPIAIFGDHTCKQQLLLCPFSVGPNTIPYAGSPGLDTTYCFQLVQGLVATHEYKRHWTDFADKKVLCADRLVAANYGKTVRDMLHAMLVLSRMNRNLRTTRDLLLPKLISGELDVSDFPEPETAAA